VEVSLKRKLYAAIVLGISDQFKGEYKPKPLISVLEPYSILKPVNLEFWRWLGKYYCCNLGEVMNMALPSGLKLSSETKLVANPAYSGDFSELSDDAFMIAEAISIQNELDIATIQDILQRKSIYPIIRQLIDLGIVSIQETLVERYRQKMKKVVEISVQPERLLEFTPLVEKSEKQTRALLSVYQLAKAGNHPMFLSDVQKLCGEDMAVFRAMEKKKILEIKELPVSRIAGKYLSSNNSDNIQLSEIQLNAINEINQLFKDRKTVLLHGVTGSGKTIIYIQLIREALEKGKQVLYLLPEIALTTQIVKTIVSMIDFPVYTYHSKMNDQERVEVWKAAGEGSALYLGARSSVFLPFFDLGLIIVDEEHDPSYKQQETNPRYNARDAAVFLGTKYACPVLLGSATPSIESYFNAKSEKYGYVSMMSRHGNSTIPEIEIVDLKKEIKNKHFDGLISDRLKSTCMDALGRGEQIILFQNRRGYAPVLKCQTCGWKSGCSNCDVSLTLHKAKNEMRCHYCGYRTARPQKCPACGLHTLQEEGFGTEKMENAVAEVFPSYKVARLDLDNAPNKAVLEQILDQFNDGDIQILVGTQMLTKGLDFGQVTVVGILHADTLWRYPDLRAGERAFQLITQVAGRAGRRDKPGKVLIQTYTPEHPVLLDAISLNYTHFFTRELEERKKFIYPPYCRLIQIDISHKAPEIAEGAASWLSNKLREHLSNRILGPSSAPIPRMRGVYIYQILVKHETQPALGWKIKQTILDVLDEMQTHHVHKKARIIINVDPY
jgi:primosomal protein N' (replication factor Y)